MYLLLFNSHHIAICSVYSEDGCDEYMLDDNDEISDDGLDNKEKNICELYFEYIYTYSVDEIIWKTGDWK